MDHGNVISKEQIHRSANDAVKTKHHTLRQPMQSQYYPLLCRYESVGAGGFKTLPNTQAQSNSSHS